MTACAGDAGTNALPEPRADRKESGFSSVEAQLLLGQLALQRGDHDAALEWFRIASRHGDARGFNMLGRCYERGWGVAVDEEMAVAYFRHAAELGDAWATFNLADAYARGRGCQRDDGLAYTYYVKAAGLGHAKSLNMLGLFHEEGRAVAADESAAREFFRAGAEAGDCWAQFNHARMLIGDREISGAVVWLDKALDSGFPDFWMSMAEILSAISEPQLQAIGRKARALSAGNS